MMQNGAKIQDAEIAIEKCLKIQVKANKDYIQATYTEMRNLEMQIYEFNRIRASRVNDDGVVEYYIQSVRNPNFQPICLPPGYAA